MIFAWDGPFISSCKKNMVLPVVLKSLDDLKLKPAVITHKYG